MAWSERRDLYPEGVASGDPDAHSVLLWARHPFSSETQGWLRVEVSEDQTFSQVVATARAKVSAASDWTCRILVGNLHPSRVYWYRFSDDSGLGSRIGRTLTAPADDDARPVKFAFLCCQNTNVGAQNVYRRMIFEDERANAAARLDFVLHLGDFIYEIVWYPEEHPDGVYGRHLSDVVRYPHGEKVGEFYIPTTLEDYRAIYRAYLHDTDLQDARARWPFVPIWDNHEFSQAGWQSLQVFQGKTRPSQSRKVAANQAWFEYLPARIKKASGPSLDRFDPPQVADVPVQRFDDHGLGQEPNNLAALASLTGYRSLRWGRHVEILITDQRSYRSEGASSRPEAKALWSTDFPKMIPQEALEILDAGSAYANGHAPAGIRFGSTNIPNFRRNEPPQTILGAQQKGWFLSRLKASSATWKVWGNTTGTLDRRVDPQNLPPGITSPWPGAGYATFEDGDHGSAFVERAEIYSVVSREKISGFVTIAGDRHSFWAGLAAPTLPPQKLEPVGVAFITASISMINSADSLSQAVPRDHPLRSLYFLDRPQDKHPQPTVNMLLRHGVRACLEYARTGDADWARKLTNPELAPHLRFLDFGGHGYATVLASGDAMECEFVCLPRPVERATTPDGGPLIYRVVHRVPLWVPGETPSLQQRIVEGNPDLSI
jgi:alkaline phosphatase D